MPKNDVHASLLEGGEHFSTSAELLNRNQMRAYRSSERHIYDAIMAEVLPMIGDRSMHHRIVCGGRGIKSTKPV